MNWKTVGTIIIILLVIAVGTGIYVAMTKTTESQRGQVINNFNNEPHFGFLGCSRYIIPDNLNITTKPSVQELNKAKK